MKFIYTIILSGAALMWSSQALAQESRYAEDTREENQESVLKEWEESKAEEQLENLKHDERMAKKEERRARKELKQKRKALSAERKAQKARKRADRLTRRADRN